MRRPTPTIPCAAVIAALAALLLPSSPIGAHELTQGVGTQTTFHLFPDRLEIELNLGFSASAGFPVLNQLDANGDDRVDADEAARLVDERGSALLPFLHLRVNGRPVAMTIVSGEEVGVRGSIVPHSFDLYYQVVAHLPAELPEGGWWLHYRDASFEGQTASQFCWLPWDGHEVGDWKIFEPIALEQDIGFRTAGRELVLFFDDVFRPDVEPGKTAPPSAESLAAIPLPGSAAPPEIAASGAAPVSRRGEPIAPSLAEETPGEEERMGEMVRALASGERSGIELVLTLLLAVVFGAGHALGPGHGKSMVAAYLVGSRGRIRDAITLGAVVTFAHTFSIFLLGLLLLWLIERSADRVAGATYQNWLTTGFSMLSGVLLLLFGLLLVGRRLRVARGLAEPHGHGHSHDHSHDHGHGHSHGHRWWQHSHPQLGGRTAAHSHGLSHEPSRDHGHSHPHPHEHSHSHTHSGGVTHSHGHAHEHAHEAPHDPTHSEDAGHAHLHGAGDHHHSEHEHSHEHGHPHDHEHTHTHPGGLTHSHAHGPGHSHEAAHPTEEHAAIGERVRFGDLVALGLSGGIVPCPAGFTIMLVAAHYQALALGLVILGFFSFGLGALLCAIGVVLVLGKDRILDRFGTRSGTVMRWLPVLSAILVSCIGIYFMWDSYSRGRTEISQMLRALANLIGG